LRGVHGMKCQYYHTVCRRQQKARMCDDELDKSVESLASLQLCRLVLPALQELIANLPVLTGLSSGHPRLDRVYFYTAELTLLYSYTLGSDVHACHLTLY